MAKKAKVTLHPSFEIGEISPRLFGAFLEPIGTMVNGTMYNPKHPTADEQGFRTDVIKALNEAGLPCVRLPGGNFVSCWDWKDSIGPKEQRKKHLDLAWHQYYPNDVGHDEYLQWAEKVGFEPMYTINLGTGDINDAMKIIEYTNHEGGTWWSDLRKEYGHEKPYGVKVWYLGNEVDGPWQLGSWEKDPRGYGIRVHEVSKAMKFTDGSIETIACVSSEPYLAHYPQWDLEVLQECYETVDYISLHHYHTARMGDIGAWLGGSETFEDYIRTEIALCDFVKTKLRSTKTMMLSFDEWASSMRNPDKIHYGKNGQIDINDYDIINFHPEGDFVKHDPDNMVHRNMFDRGSPIMSAIASASVMLTFMRHADRIKIGCMTAGIGVLCASDHDHVWKSVSYYPYKQILDYAKGVSLLPEVESETYEIPGYWIDDMHQYDTRKGVKYIEAAAASNKETGELNVFVINRDWNDDAEFTLDVEGFKGYQFLGHTELYSDDPNAADTYENPDAVVPKESPNAVCADGKITTVLRKCSFNLFRFKK